MFTARELKDWNVKVLKGEEWFPARPIDCRSIYLRFKEAYGVFIGKLDALSWENEDVQRRG